MSIRAYRVIKIEYAKPNSFNLYHDGKLVNFLDQEYGFYETLPDGTGITELPIEALEEALEKVEMDDEVREALKNDIQAARDEDQDHVRYYCF